MNQRAIQELVDSYLLGQISPENKKMLLDLVEADPVFAQQVRESEETFRLLKAARDRELRQKLLTWDTEAKKSISGKKRLLYCLAFILLLISLWCWMDNHFSREHIAYQSFNAVQRQIPATPQDSGSWQKGIEAFRQRDYDKALLIFLTLAENQTSPAAYYATWNVLLCQLALYGPDENWENEMEALSRLSPDPIKANAVELLKKIHSPFYRIWYRSMFHKSLTSVKPKII